MSNQTETSNNLNSDEITLRCNKCGRPITPEEAVQTPTGYRCPDCVRQQQKVFDTSKPLDYLWSFLIAVTLSAVASGLTSLIGFFTFLLAPAAGVVIAEVVRVVIKKRRSKRLFKLVSAAIILGGMPLILLNLFQLVASLSLGSFRILSLLPLGYKVLFLILAVPSAYYRLSGSQR